MPTLSEFFGITIRMKYLDHNPPHFHAQYQEDKISVEILNGKIKGEMSERALKLVLEWLDLHRKDLLEAWNQSSNIINILDEIRNSFSKIRGNNFKGRKPLPF